MSVDRKLGPMSEEVDWGDDSPHGGVRLGSCRVKAEKILLEPKLHELKIATWGGEMQEPLQKERRK